MSTGIHYCPPAPQVNRSPVCYQVGTGPVLHGFEFITYIGEEEVERRIESLERATVTGAVLAACPVEIVQNVNNKTVIVMKNRITNVLVYAVQVINTDASVTTTYWNIGGDTYIGDIDDLDIYEGDKLNYTAPVVFCVDGQTSVTRTDVWDEDRHLVTSIWQDLLGAIVPEPTGTLKAGACDLVLDVEVISQVDNILDSGEITGRYVNFYRVNVFDSTGTVVYSKMELANGTMYTPVGRVTVSPIVPGLVAGIKELSTNGETWEITNRLVQSLAITGRLLTRNKTAVVTTPKGSIILDSPCFEANWSVDGSADPYLKGFKVEVRNGARLYINWTEQLELIDVTELVMGGSGYGYGPTDPLDHLIPTPDDLSGSGY